MKRFIPFDRALVAVTLAALALPLAQAAHAGPPAPAVPDAIQVPAGNKLFLVGHAVGVQIYRCNATSGGYRWDFVAPRASLYDGNGKLLTTHFAGPSWEARDGSLVKAAVAARAEVAEAIPWLLLSVTSASAGPDGDRLAGATFIQRLDTTGGLAPAAGECDEDAAGTTREIPYTADYAFFKSVSA